MAAACKTRDLCRHRSTGGPPESVQRHVAIEVPDLPAFHAYAAVCRSLGNREALPVMVSSREDFLGQRGRAALEGTSRPSWKQADPRRCLSTSYREAVGSRSRSNSRVTNSSWQLASTASGWQHHGSGFAHDEALSPGSLSSLGGPGSLVTPLAVRGRT